MKRIHHKTSNKSNIKISENNTTILFGYKIRKITHLPCHLLLTLIYSLSTVANIDEFFFKSGIPFNFGKAIPVSLEIKYSV